MPLKNNKRVQESIILFCICNDAINGDDIFKVLRGLLLVHKDNVSELFHIIFSGLEVIEIVTINATFLITYI